MKSLQYSKMMMKVMFLITLALYTTLMSSAQTVRRFEEHEVIEIGNGMKLEILRSRGTGENEEWDVIYYTDKRQLGKRKWEKTSKILELQQAATAATKQAKPEIKQNEPIAKSPAKSTGENPVKKEAVVPAANSITESSPAKTSQVSQKDKDVAKSDRKDNAALKTLPIDSTLSASGSTPGESKPVVNPASTQPEVVKTSDASAGSVPTIVPQIAKVSRPDSTMPAESSNQQTAPPITVLQSHAGSVSHTLADCYRMALDKNLTIKQAANLVASSSIDHKTAQYSLLPSLSYNLGHYFSFGKNIDPVTNAFVNNNFSGGYTAVNLQLQLFSGFSRLNTIKQSVYSIQSAEYYKKRMELELLTNVTLIYARLLQDKEQILVERKNIRGTNKQIEVVNEKIKVGRLSKYEFYTFNGRLNTQQANLVSLQNDSSSASQDLKQLLNISHTENLEIAPLDTNALADIYTAKISISEFAETVLTNHPAIKQAEMQKQAAELGEKIAKSSYYPSLSVGGNIASNYNADQTNASGGKIPLYSQLNDNIGKNININLRIPLFSQMQSANRVKKEVINISNAQIALEQARNTIATNTIKLVNDFNSAREKYAASRIAWEQNNLSYNLYEEKYRLGQISSMELLMAQDTQNASTLQYLQARLQLFFQYQLIGLLKGY